MIVNIDTGFKSCTNIAFRLYAKVCCSVVKLFGARQIPIIINNYNRLECLLKQLKWLEGAGYKRIFIIDNASTYPPLLEFYKKSKHIVFRLDKNLGHTAYWQTQIPMLFKNQRFVLTDPDVVAIGKCPNDFLHYFNCLLDHYIDVDKVGFGLKIDDIPDTYPNKEKVINWESKFWEDKVGYNVYKASIDTTFALYRENSSGDPAMMNALRTGGEYVCRHLPWYINPEELSDEDKYYIENATNISSWTAQLKGETAKY